MGLNILGAEAGHFSHQALQKPVEELISISCVEAGNI